MNDHKQNKMENQGFFYEKDDFGEWIRIRVYGFDFSISLFQQENRYMWTTGMRHAFENKLSLPSKKQWEVVNIYKDKINKIISKHKGDLIHGVYWSADITKKGSDKAWCYYCEGDGVILSHIGCDFLQIRFVNKPFVNSLNIDAIIRSVGDYTTKK